MELLSWESELLARWPVLAGIVLALYYAVLGTLAAYGVHRLILVWTFWRHHTRSRTAAEAANAEATSPAVPDSWPTVTVQLPIFNELYVAGRLIDAVCGLDYPRDQLQIQVLDDSTDETRDVVEEHVARYRNQGLDIHHLHREERSGYKAGALAAGTLQARGELLAVFDADFVPPADFLRRVVPSFADPGIGMVQARWGHLNRDSSLLTKVQAVMLDGHFVVEHSARHLRGCFFNFNGTAGVWRRQAITDAGGWEHDTLTEDLDLSYRAQLAGWRFRYLPEVVVPAELPAEVNSFKSQQHRWAKGSIQTCRKLLIGLLRAPLPLRTRLEAFVHLTANWSYVLMLALAVLIFPAMALRRGTDAWQLLAIDLPLFTAATVSVLLFYAVSQLAGEGGAKGLRQLPSLMGLGMGLAVNNSRAVLAGALFDGGVFHRTPKYSLSGERQTQAPVGTNAYRLQRPISFYLEALLALYFVLCCAAAVYLRMWLSLPFLLLFLHGYAYMTLLGLSPRSRRLRLRTAGATG